MSATVIKLPSARRGASRDAEFLPAALEILERPPSPVRMALILIIAALATVSLIWGYVGCIDIVAVAQGKIQPTGRVKIVQPSEPGRIRAIRVWNGQHAEAGEVLVEFDSAEAVAEETALRFSLAAAKAEALRRTTAVVRVQSNRPALPIMWTAEIPASIRRREELVLAGDMRQLETTVLSLTAQRRLKEAERDRLRETVRSQRDLVAVLRERVSMRTALVESSSGTKASVIDATEILLTQQATLSTELGQQGEAEVAIEVAAREISRARDTFLADNLQKLAEVERQADDLGQRFAKAHEHTDHMTLRAPITGTVQASSVTTIGQVAVLGEELMRIVPDDSQLEIEAYLQNKDVGFVRVGQGVEIKIESLPFTRYGTVPGTVVRLASDAVPEPDAQLIEGNPARSNRSTGFTGGTQRTQNLVFPMIVRPDMTSLMADGWKIALSPGMAVSIEIKTGSRRIIEYIFSPLIETATGSMHER